MSGPETKTPVNGVVIERTSTAQEDYRSYEVYQRERPGESTEKIAPGQLAHKRQLTEPYATLGILRENYPCYRDWSGNAYWLTRYNDVTSVFSDRANFQVASRAVDCGLPDAADLSADLDAQRVWAQLIDEHWARVCESLLVDLEARQSFDLSIDFALGAVNELRRLALGLDARHGTRFARLWWAIERADCWEPAVAQQGQRAVAELAELLESAAARGAQSGLRACYPDASPRDLIATVLGFEGRTLHGWIANLCHAWLSEVAVERYVRQNSANLKIAALETMRFAPPVTVAHCRTRHEVERFGRLLPEGALIRLSATAANRDPRVFHDPDQFLVGRKDLCHREARGQYRADGLATGIAFGMGLPSRYPAVPEDRPRSLYALTRDATVIATSAVLALKPLCSTSSLSPIRSLSLFEPMIGWSLPVSSATR